MGDLGERFLRCFDRAVDDVELPADPTFRAALHAYMRWAAEDALCWAAEDVLSYSAEDAVVAAGAAMPRWGWEGLQT
jgi:hemoglobin